MIERAIDGVHVVKLLQKLNIAMFYVLFDGHTLNDCQMKMFFFY